MKRSSMKDVFEIIVRQTVEVRMLAGALLFAATLSAGAVVAFLLADGSPTESGIARNPAHEASTSVNFESGGGIASFAPRESAELPGKHGAPNHHERLPAEIAAPPPRAASGVARGLNLTPSQPSGTAVTHGTKSYRSAPASFGHNPEASLNQQPSGAAGTVRLELNPARAVANTNSAASSFVATNGTEARDLLPERSGGLPAEPRAPTDRDAIESRVPNLKQPAAKSAAPSPPRPMRSWPKPFSPEEERLRQQMGVQAFINFQHELATGAARDAAE